MGWTLDEAVKFAVILEGLAPLHGAHVALTGGVLYREGTRKDVDFIFYRIRQKRKIRVVGLFADLATLGIKVTGDYGYVVKATYEGKDLDFMFPEGQNGDGDYEPDALDVALPTANYSGINLAELI